MTFEFPKENYMFDGHGDKVTIGNFKSIHSSLFQKGYENIDVSYGKSIHMPMVVIDSLFEPIEESATVVNNTKTDSFATEYHFWYNKDLDMYVNVIQKDSDEFYNEDEPTSDFCKLNVAYYKPSRASEVFKFLNEHTVRQLSSSNKIDIIIQTMKGFEFKSHTIKSPKIDIEKMYNDDFKPVYDHVVDKLNNGNKGVVLFYGEPGTGKTSLIKHLTTVVDSKFVFVPINMIAHVSSPQFIGDLITNKGGVLVLEDCENFIQDRKTAGDSIVSPLLQITDGILSDILDVKIICTFNTDLTKVDEALRREGRLIAEYQFKELDTKKADALAGKTVEGKKTLANIFNDLTYKDSNLEEKEKLIGFGR